MLTCSRAMTIASVREMACRSILALLYVFLLSDEASSAEPPKKLTRNQQTLVQVEDVPGLPRMLLIGDSISMFYTLPVRTLLEGQANVHRPPVNCRSSKQILAELDDYLGSNPWDVIHFNCGGHDITYRKNEKPTPPPEGTIQVPLDEYKQNLRTIVKRLKKTGARLIWASTTPMGQEYIKQGFRFESDILAYNVAAAEIMKQEGIPINDLYTLTKANIEKLVKDGVHFTDQGSDILAKAVANSIQRELSAARN
jgi:lysophospholipase L1-like esterase